MSAILDLSTSKVDAVPNEFPQYEHKKFSKRRRSSACSCGSEDDAQQSTCKLGNCQKYKYFAASGAHGVAIYNSLAGTYEIINDPVSESSGEGAEQEHCAADLDYEYVKADGFLENPLKHLLYIIRRTHRRVSSL